jgi:negative regulator of flagellin synthesis FlgM
VAAEASGAALLEPALAALRAQPEVDLERVAAVKAALARGEVKFDPDRLAALIDRYHGGRG